MEAKQTITITVTKGDHDFTFHMPVGTTWGSAVDAAYDVLQHVGEMAKQSISQNKPAENASVEVVHPTLVEGKTDAN